MKPLAFVAFLVFACAVAGLLAVVRRARRAAELERAEEILRAAIEEPREG